MRILTVTNLYPPDVVGGYELGCAQMVAALGRRGHEVKVLTATAREPVPHSDQVWRRMRLVNLFDAELHSARRSQADAAVMVEANLVSLHNIHVLAAAIGEFS